MMSEAVSERDPGDQRQVRVGDRVDRQRAEPGQAEDVLRDDRAAEQAGEVEAGRRDDRGQPGAQGVLDDDRALGQALGPRGAHVVVVEDLEHLVAGEPHVERGVQDREHDPRQDHRLEELDRVLERRDVAAGTAASCHLDDDEEDQDEADEERRERVADQRYPHHQPVRPASAAERGEDAQGDRRR